MKPRSPRAFVERMAGVAGTRMEAFHEEVSGTEVRVFGDVAVAAAGCGITENGAGVTRGVEMLLLVKDEGRWQIVAQGRDTESVGLRLPPDLAGEAQD